VCDVVTQNREKRGEDEKEKTFALKYLKTLVGKGMCVLISPTLS
jgi:hypothetical protein